MIKTFPNSKLIEMVISEDIDETTREEAINEMVRRFNMLLDQVSKPQLYYREQFPANREEADGFGIDISAKVKVPRRVKRVIEAAGRIGKALKQ